MSTIYSIKKIIFIAFYTSCFSLSFAWGFPQIHSGNYDADDSTIVQTTPTDNDAKPNNDKQDNKDHQDKQDKLGNMDSTESEVSKDSTDSEEREDNKENKDYQDSKATKDKQDYTDRTESEVSKDNKDYKGYKDSQDKQNSGDYEGNQGNKANKTKREKQDRQEKKDYKAKKAYKPSKGNKINQSSKLKRSKADSKARNNRKVRSESKLTRRRITDLNRSLPQDVLAFPYASEDYKSKIVNVEDTQIWSQKKLNKWAHSQGFLITEDSDDGGYQFGRGLVFYSPGISFRLVKRVDHRAGDHDFGWTLVLDMALIHQKKIRSMAYNKRFIYKNILRYEVWIDGIYYKTIEVGYNQTNRSPVKIHIPYIRDESGNVAIQIKMKNNPRNFGILYDAYLKLN